MSPVFLSGFEFNRESNEKVDFAKLKEVHRLGLIEAQRIFDNMSPAEKAKFEEFRLKKAAHNKGKKMPFNPNSARTQFKKGQRPHTWRGAGHERVDKKDGYVIMIVDEPNPHTGASTRPVLKHRYLWEKLNGPVPEGHRLKCLDGDKTNTDPSNWEAIPAAMAPRLNGRHGRGYDDAPAELKPTIMLTAKLEHAAREAKKR